MTAITLVLGESRTVGELGKDNSFSFEITPEGCEFGNVFRKADGWQIEQPPFVFPTARSAVIAPADENQSLRWLKGDGVWLAENGNHWEEYEILALNIPLRVIFAGEVE